MMYLDLSLSGGVCMKNIRFAMGMCILSAVAGFTTARPAHADTTIDANRAVRVTLPKPAGGVASFKTTDGKEGWVRQLSKESISTPAFAKGRLFTGIGVSSTTFVAVDAGTGALVWQQAGGENGPTAPVIEDNGVYFNTES